MRRIVGILWLVFLTCRVCFAQEVPPNIDTDFWKPNSYNVYMDVDTSNQLLYTLGLFDYVGPSNPHYGMGDATEGSYIKTPFTSNGKVTVTAGDGQGGFFIAGEFSEIENQPRLGLAHLDDMGNLSGWQAQILESETPIQFLYFANNELYVQTANNNLITLSPQTGEVTNVISKFGNQYGSVLLNMAENEEHLYVGGRYTHINAGSSRGIEINIEGEAEIVAGPDFNDMVLGSVPDGEGGWFVCGEFTSVGQFYRKNFVHLNAANEVMPWQIEHNGSELTAIEYKDGTVYISGNFTEVAGEPRVRLAALDANSGELLPELTKINSQASDLHVNGDMLFGAGSFRIAGEFNPNLSIHGSEDGTSLSMEAIRDIDGTVNEVISDGDGGYFIGGAFTSMNGISRQGLAHLNESGILQPLSISLSHEGNNGKINKLILKGDTLFIAGLFDSVNGSAHSSLAALSISSQELLDWTFNVTNKATLPAEIIDAQLEGDELFLVGEFEAINGLARSKVASINIMEQQISGLNFRFKSSSVSEERPLRAITAYDNKIFIGGDFTRIGEIMESCVVDDEFAQVQNPLSMIKSVSASVSDGQGGWYVAGNFNTVQDQPRNKLAHIDGQGQLTDFNLELESEVSIDCLALKDDVLIVGGDFEVFAGEDINDLAIVHLDDFTIEGIGMGGHANAGVRSLALSGDTLLVGGRFYTIQSTPIRCLAAINLAAQDYPLFDWAPGNLDATTYSSIDQIIPSGDTLFLHGTMNGANSLFYESRYEVAAINRQTGLLLDWDPELSPTNDIYEILIFQNQLLVAGDFNSIAGTDENYLAAFNVNDLSHTPLPFTIDDAVTALTNIGPRLYLGGDFEHINDEPRYKLAAYDTETGQLLPWKTDHEGLSSANIHSLNTDGNNIYIEGVFTAPLGGSARTNFALINRENYQLEAFSPDLDYDLDISSGNEVYDLVTHNGYLYLAGRFSLYDGMERPHIARINLGDLSLSNWSTNINGPVHTVYPTLENIYVGGDFDANGWLDVLNFGVIDASNGAPINLDIKSTGIVNTILPSTNQILIGGQSDEIGNFEQVESFFAYHLPSNTANPWTFKPDASNNNDVTCIQTYGNTVYLGGDFTISHDSEEYHHLVAFNQNNGQFLTQNFGLNEVNNEIIDFTIDGNTMYTAHQYGSSPIKSFNLDTETQNSFSASLSGNDKLTQVFASGGRVFIGGRVESVNGESVSHFAELSSTGTLTNSSLNFDSQYITDLSGTDNSIFVGGGFVSVGGEKRNSLTRIDFNTGMIDDWDPNVGGASFGQVVPYIKKVELTDQKIVIAGSFQNVDGILRKNLASISLDTDELDGWYPFVYGDIHTIEVYESTVFVSGEFEHLIDENFGGVHRETLGALDLQTGLATDWNPTLSTLTSTNIDPLVNAMYVENNRLFVSGRFREISGTDKHNIAAIDLNSMEVVENWNYSTDGEVKTLVFSEENFIITGWFDSAGGVVRKGAAAIDLNTGLPTLWSPIVEGYVDAIVIHEDALFVGLDGTITSEDGTVQSDLVKIDLTTGNVLEWDAPVGFSNFYYGTVNFETFDDLLLIAGGFPVDIEISSLGIMAINMDSGEPEDIFSGLNVDDFVLSGDSLLLINSEQPVPGPHFQYLRSFHIPTAQLGAVFIEIDGAEEIDIVEDRLYIGGDFTQILGSDRPGVASFNMSDLSLTNWSPPALVHNPFAFDSYNDQLFTLGNLYWTPDLPEEYVGFITSDSTGLLQSWNPEISNGTDMMIHGNRMFISGRMRQVKSDGAYYSEWPEYGFNAISLEPCEGVIDCQDLTIELDSDEFTVSLDQILPYSSVCNEANITLSQSVFNCEDVGVHLIDVNMQDEFNNQASCTATITITLAESYDDDADGIGNSCDFCFGDNASGDSDGDGICNDAEIVGCQDESACDFNPDATDTGTCLNYPEPDCTMCDETPGSTELILIDDDGDGVCNADEIVGCMHPTASNFDPFATDPGWCAAGGFEEAVDTPSEFEPEDTGGFGLVGNPGGPESTWYFTLYPNPWQNSERLILQLGDVPSESTFELRCFDMTGKLVAKQNFQAKKEFNQYHLELTSHLESGLYLLTLTDYSGRFRQHKLLIER